MSVCLLYHGVGAALAGRHASLDVPRARFARQMRAIRARGGITISFDDAYASLEDYALPLILELGLSAKVFVVTGAIGGQSHWTGEGSPRAIMGVGSLRDFSARGIAFGAHSRTHPDLTRLYEVSAEREIAGSKTELEDLLGRSISAFAYPYGAYDRRIRDIAARHFEYGYTTREGRIVEGDDPLTLNRTMVQPFNPHLDFLLQCRWGFSPLEALRRWRRF